MGRSYHGGVKGIDRWRRVFSRGSSGVGARPLWQPASPSPRRTVWILTTTIILMMMVWLALVLRVDSIRFVVLDPRAKTGFEVFLAIGQLFGAFVLALSPVETSSDRMRWVASGFLVLAIGALGFGYLYPLVSDSPHLSATMYGSIYVRAVGTVLIAVGVASPTAPRMQRTLAVGLIAVAGVIGIVLAMVADALPPLVRVAGTGTRGVPAQLADVEQLVSSTHAVFPGLTGWHWGLSLAPLVAGVVAACGAIRPSSRQPTGTWLLVAVLLLVGGHLHSLFWPSMYSSVLTTTSLLRLAVAVVVIIGGVLELRRVVDERAALLAEEQERVRRLEELTALKADFTSIVAHELATPLAAITTMSEMLSTGDLPTDQCQRVGQSIETEARLLQLLVSDVRMSADVERDDFRVQPQRTAVSVLLAEAQAYVRTLPDTHPVTVESETDAHAVADRERIGQVLRNLLTNAIRHTPPGTPITLQATPADSGDVTIAVADRGPGISEQDQVRIFEKFGRGGDAAHRPAGRGLGLYLSRRILQAHGSDLFVDSTLGMGTTFRFTLEESP